MSVKKLTRLSLLTAIALIIFIIELRIPDIVPIPGVKLGLANIVTVYAMYSYSPKETLMILSVRILLGSVFSGNISAIMYSLSGALLCFCGMLVLKHITDKKYIWLCSIIGAVLHNTGQILTAILVMKTTAVFTYFPFLIVSGCIAGAFTGICTQVLISRINFTE
ncbi:MAG: Gx transporter family protein, partial [Ruminococcus sp.]|nr:Gx transporter family protein [Ruminococcus sp.]MDE6798271.1 Gx transporter family protein [Ruminococcus sp.]